MCPPQQSGGLRVPNRTRRVWGTHGWGVGTLQGGAVVLLVLVSA